jgi:hypothetical protein
MNTPDVTEQPESANAGCVQRVVMPPTDWQGKPITEPEEPTKLVKVWMIEPHPTDSAYDACLCRSYQHAVEAMKQAIENTVDAAEEETLTNEGVTVKVKVIEMRLCEYEAEISQD